MQLFQDPSETELMDVLAEYTARYNRLCKEGGTKEQFDTCRQAVMFLIAEIEARHKKEETNHSTDNEL